MPTPKRAQAGQVQVVALQGILGHYLANTTNEALEPVSLPCSGLLNDWESCYLNFVFI